MGAPLRHLEDTADLLRRQILGLLEIRGHLPEVVSDIRREIKRNNIVPEPLGEPAPPLPPLPKAEAKPKPKRIEKNRVKLYAVNCWDPYPYLVGVYRRRSDTLDIFNGNPNRKGRAYTGFKTDNEDSAVNYWYQSWERESPRF
jgi:hypothetical protein